MKSKGTVSDRGSGLQDGSRIKSQQWEITPRADITPNLSPETWHDQRYHER